MRPCSVLLRNPGPAQVLCRARASPCLSLRGRAATPQRPRTSCIASYAFSDREPEHGRRETVTWHASQDSTSSPCPEIQDADAPERQFKRRIHFPGGKSLELEGSREDSWGRLPRRVALAFGFSSVAALSLFHPSCAELADAAEQAASSGQVSKDSVLRDAIKANITPAKCPGVLRLAFHDAGTYDKASNTGGSNGSVIYELDRRESDGLKRYVKVMGKVREQLSSQGIEVSWADAIAMGGAVAVEMCGGLHIPVRIGRIDSGRADEPGRMPSETFNAEEVIRSFEGKGFSLQETVALLGGHTLGGKGFGDATKFDNSYYSILLQRPWNNPNDKMAYMIGLPSDKAIVESQDARKWIEVYAADEGRFFKDFAAAYVKMVDSGAVWEA